MSAPSLTYSLTNGNTADASQVMQNFNDLLNGYTDGTKDLTISALTVNGAASFKGAVTLGDAAADDITHTGALASSIPIKTTNTYDIGSSTLGLAGCYFGTGSTQTARIVATATFAASRTYTLLDAGAAANFVLSEGTATINGTKTFGGQLIGKGTATNDSASAGYIGETMTQSKVRSAASSTTTGTNANVTSSALSLTAGDWLVSGMVLFIPGATTTTTLLQAGLSTTSATLPGTDYRGAGDGTGNVYTQVSYPTGTVVANDQVIVIPPIRVTLSGSASLYLIAVATFGASTMSIAGSMTAVRIR